MKRYAIYGAGSLGTVLGAYILSPAKILTTPPKTRKKH